MQFKMQFARRSEEEYIKDLEAKVRVFLSEVEALLKKLSERK